MPQYPEPSQLSTEDKLFELDQIMELGGFGNLTPDELRQAAILLREQGLTVKQFHDAMEGGFVNQPRGRQQ